MMPYTPTFWAADEHGFEKTYYPSLVLAVVVLIFVSSTIIIVIVCCSVVHAFTHRYIYHMNRLDTHHATKKKSSTDSETGSLTTTIDCLVSAKTEGSRFCMIAVPTISNQENYPSSTPPIETCRDVTKPMAVDLMISIARNSRPLYALPEENSENICADDNSPSSQSSAMEDDVFVLIDRHGQRRSFHSEYLGDTSNGHINRDQQDSLSQKHVTDSIQEHHHPLWQHSAPQQPHQIGNTSNVLPVNTDPGDRQSNSICSIHSNSGKSNNRQDTRPASLDWKSFDHQSKESTKNWNSETLVGNSAIEQTESFNRQPMRMCLAEVGIARLFPFCDSDKAKMTVIAKQTITSNYANCLITNLEPPNEIT